MTSEDAVGRLEVLSKAFPDTNDFKKIAILIMKMDLVIVSSMYRLQDYFNIADIEKKDATITKALAILSNRNPEANVPKVEDNLK